LVFLIIMSAGCIQQETASNTVVDQLGREVGLPSDVESVVSLWPEATRTLYALGVKNKIVGLDSDSIKCPILTRAFPEISAIPNMGSAIKGTLSMEKLAQVNPDIIFMRTDDSDLADTIQTSLGIPVVCVRMHPPPEQQVSFDMITIIGSCVGEDQRAAEVKTYLEGKLSDVSSVTAHMPDSDKPSVYQAFAFDLLKTIGYFDVLELAGGRNVAQGSKNAWYAVSLEDIIVWNPDIIILHGFGKFKPDDLYDDPNWQSISAVKNRKVYRLTLGWCGWDPAGFVINVMCNAKVFHPDEIEFDVEKESNEIFKKLYGSNKLYSKLKLDYQLSDV